MTVQVVPRQTVIDVTRAPFNAKGDGATDDWTAFRAAIEAAGDRGGAIIDVPSGAYRVDTASHGPLTGNGHANVTLRGQGWAATDLQCTGPFLVAGNSSDQWTIDGLRIRNTTTTNTHDGIVVDYPRRWLVTRCRIEGFGGDGIRFEGGLHSAVEFNHIAAKDPSGTNGHAGIYVRKTGGGVVATTMRSRHNYVMSGKQYGILVEDTTDSMWESDIVEGCAVGMRFARASGELHYPYTEAITTASLEIHDSYRLHRTLGRFYSGPTAVSVTWSGVAAADRYTTQHGTGAYPNDHVLGRDVTVGRNALVGGQLAVGTATPDGLATFVESGAVGSEATLTLQNTRYNDATSAAALRFRHYTPGGGQTGAGGKVQSDRTGAYNEAANSHDADLVLFAAINDADVERLRLLSDGGLFVPNTTEPATPTGGGVLYVEDGSLKYKGSGGTVTTLGPA